MSHASPGYSPEGPPPPPAVAAPAPPPALETGPPPPPPALEFIPFQPDPESIEIPLLPVEAQIVAPRGLRGWLSARRQAFLGGRQTRRNADDSFRYGNARAHHEALMGLDELPTNDDDLVSLHSMKPGPFDQASFFAGSYRKQRGDFYDATAVWAPRSPEDQDSVPGYKRVPRPRSRWQELFAIRANRRADAINNRTRNQYRHEAPWGDVIHDKDALARELASGRHPKHERNAMALAGRNAQAADRSKQRILNRLIRSYERPMRRLGIGRPAAVNIERLSPEIAQNKPINFRENHLWRSQVDLLLSVIPDHSFNSKGEYQVGGYDKLVRRLRRLETKRYEDIFKRERKPEEIMSPDEPVLEPDPEPTPIPDSPEYARILEQIRRIENGTYPTVEPVRLTSKSGGISLNEAMRLVTPDPKKKAREDEEGDDDSRIRGTTSRLSTDRTPRIDQRVGSGDTSKSTTTTRHSTETSTERTDDSLLGSEQTAKLAESIRDEHSTLKRKLMEAKGDGTLSEDQERLLEEVDGKWLVIQPEIDRITDRMIDNVLASVEDEDVPFEELRDQVRSDVYAYFRSQKAQRKR